MHIMTMRRVVVKVIYFAFTASGEWNFIVKALTCIFYNKKRCFFYLEVIKSLHDGYLRNFSKIFTFQKESFRIFKKLFADIKSDQFSSVNIFLTKRVTNWILIGHWPHMLCYSWLEKIEDNLMKIIILCMSYFMSREEMSQYAKHVSIDSGRKQLL